MIKVQRILSSLLLPPNTLSRISQTLLYIRDGVAQSRGHAADGIVEGVAQTAEEAAAYGEKRSNLSIMEVGDG